MDTEQQVADALRSRLGGVITSVKREEGRWHITVRVSSSQAMQAEAEKFAVVWAELGEAGVTDESVDVTFQSRF
jgi:hypothetical protein